MQSAVADTNVTMIFFLHAYPVVAKDKPTALRHARELEKIRKKFRAHLKQLQAPQLEELNRVLRWYIRREAYAIEHNGGPKPDKRASDSPLQPAEKRRHAARGKRMGVPLARVEEIRQKARAAERTEGMIAKKKNTHRKRGW